jgi:hypothetical protein
MQLDKMAETIEAFALAAVAPAMVPAQPKSAEPLLAVLPSQGQVPRLMPATRCSYLAEAAEFTRKSLNAIELVFKEIEAQKGSNFLLNGQLDKVE